MFASFDAVGNLNSVSRTLLGLSRLLCGGTILAAPWLLSGRPLVVQFGLTASLGIAWILYLIGRWLAHEIPSAGWSWPTTLLLLTSCGSVLLSMIQLSCPLSAGLPAVRTVAQRTAPDIDWPQPRAITGSQVPSLTRLQLARLVLAIAAFILGTQLFAEPCFRRGLWLLIGLNGAALTLFGIVQRLTWNGQLFWTFPPPFPGGAPFASFWNRNHAAGYLNLCLAAVTGLMIAGIRRSPNEWWPPRDGRQPSVRAGLVQVLLIAIPMGIMAAASRGGIVAGVIACSAIFALCAWRQRMSLARYYITTIIVSALLSLVFGVWELANSRFEGFTFQSVLSDSRWKHWRDMVPACLDLWHSGSGLGTYRYVNGPYQNHALPSTYWNADNMYLEILVEGGLPAAALMGLGCLVLAIFAKRACAGSSLDYADTADLGPTTLILLISQGIQAATDYGIIITANALTFVLMLGALTGGWGRRIVTVTEGSPRDRWMWIPIAALTFGMIAGLRELKSAADLTRMYASFGNLDVPRLGSWTSSKADAAIAQCQHLIGQRPDDFLLHRTLAQLHVIRFRQIWSALLLESADKAAPPDPEQVWELTRLVGLDALCRHYIRSGDIARMQTVRQDGAGIHIDAAYAEFQEARKWCSFNPVIDVQLAYIALAAGASPMDRARWLSSAIASAPSEHELLRELALATEPVYQDREAAYCWKRAIALAPHLRGALYREASVRLSPVYVLEHIVDVDKVSLLQFADEVNDPITRQLTAEKLKPLLSKDRIFSDGETWMQFGRVAEMEGRQIEADQNFIEAIRLDPQRWEWRLRYVDSLLLQGKRREAEMELQAALRIAPEQPELKQRQAKLRQLKDL
jgi:tetratricopeptide (TPR) repeat protein